MQRGRPRADVAQRSHAKAIQSTFMARLGELDLDMEALARRSQINRRTLDKYFEGDSPAPSFFLIAAVAEALGLSLDQLAALGRTDD